jgi:hypothetical protein
MRTTLGVERTHSLVVSCTNAQSESRAFTADHSCNQPPLAPAVASSPLASAQCGPVEQVRAIIPNTTLKSGFLGVKSRRHTLILTDRRVIFARSTMAVMKQRVADARRGARSEGKGLFGQVGAVVTWAERYLETPPDQALAETADNFAVERSAITKTSLKTKTVGRWDAEGGYTRELLILKTRGKKYEILLGSGRDQAAQALEEAEMLWTLRRLAKSIWQA